MANFYVSIDGVSDEFLAFLGYTVVAESEEFKLYRHPDGDETIVDLSDPHLLVEDVNDAKYIMQESRNGTIIVAPPK